MDEHLESMEEVFRRILKTELKLRLTPDPNKVQTVKAFLQLTNGEQLRNFLGLASYNRKFIAGL